MWIVDRGDRRNAPAVRYFAGGATRTSDTAATDSFGLVAGNPRGITTDGTNLWVVDTGTDDVYKYTTSGTFLGSWALDGRNGAPRGITINPGDVDDIWVIDSSDDDIYQYSGAASRTSGSQAADAVFNLASGNTNPQGIADPPTDSLIASGESLDTNGDGAVTSIDALLVINWLNGNRSDDRSADELDVNGDGYVSPVDTLAVINHLNFQSGTTDISSSNSDRQVREHIFSGTADDDEDDLVDEELLGLLV